MRLKPGPYAERWEYEDDPWELEAEAEREAGRKLLTKLAQIAKIPDHSRDAFCVDVNSLVNRAYEDWQYRGGFLLSLKGQIINDALKSAEQAVRAARDAVGALSDRQREFIAIAVQSQEEEVNEVARRDWLFASVEIAKRKFPDILPVMAEALARICGSNPGRRPPSRRRGLKGRRGRPRGAVGNPPFNQFVESLWWLVERYEGKLTLTTKGWRHKKWHPGYSIRASKTHLGAR